MKKIFTLTLLITSFILTPCHPSGNLADAMATIRKYEHAAMSRKETGRQERSLESAQMASAPMRGTAAEATAGMAADPVDEVKGELQKAAIRGDKDKVKRLLADGSDPKDNTDGFTALHFAAAEGYKEIATLLIDAGADVNATNNFNNRPLHFAAGEGHQDIIALLLAKGAEINAKNNGDFMPLHYAARNEHSNAIELLLDKGADRNAKTTEGDTPLNIAEKNNAGEIEKLLLNYIPSDSTAGSRLFSPSRWTRGEQVAAGATVLGLGAIAYYYWRRWKERQKAKPKQKPTPLPNK